MTLLKEKKESFPESIISFLKLQTVVTIATCMDNIPYCAACFYAFSTEDNALIFKSNRETQHVIEALKNRQVAGSILPDKSAIGKIKGLQFCGIFSEPATNLLLNAQTTYYKKFPFAVAFKGDFWVIELTFVKFIDNTLGFGKKLIWKK